MKSLYHASKLNKVLTIMQVFFQGDQKWNDNVNRHNASRVLSVHNKNDPFFKQISSASLYVNPLVEQSNGSVSMYQSKEDLLFSWRHKASRLTDVSFCNAHNTPEALVLQGFDPQRLRTGQVSSTGSNPTWKGKGGGGEGDWKHTEQNIQQLWYK